MTYKNEMVLPKNAVAMNSEDMMLVEGGGWISVAKWFAQLVLDSVVWEIVGPVLKSAAKGLTKRSKGWHKFQKGSYKFKAYWDGSKFTKYQKL